MFAKIFTGCALLSCVAFAQDSRKPGLWETSVTIQMPGAIPEERLAQMKPEQRAQVEAMLSGRMAGVMPTVVKSCETAETLKREEAFLQDKTKACKVTPVSSGGGKRVLQINCESENTKSESTLTIEIPNPEHFTGNMVMHVNSKGRNMTMNQKINGKWIGSDCGDVKPREYPK